VIEAFAPCVRHRFSKAIKAVQLKPQLKNRRATGGRFLHVQVLPGPSTAAVNRPQSRRFARLRSSRPRGASGLRVLQHRCSTATDLFNPLQTLTRLLWEPPRGGLAKRLVTSSTASQDTGAPGHLYGRWTEDCQPCQRIRVHPCLSVVKPELRNGNGGCFKASHHCHATQSGAQAHAVQTLVRSLTRPGQRDESGDCVRLIAAVSPPFLTRTGAGRDGNPGFLPPEWRVVQAVGLSASSWM
jgi:hypothetical protein